MCYLLTLRFATDLERLKKDSMDALREHQAANKDKKKRPDDPQLYWARVRCVCSTMLADVALDLLTIPSSSVPSERLFSVSGIMCAGIETCLLS